MKRPTTHWTVQQTQNGVKAILLSKKRFFTILWFVVMLPVWGYVTGNIAYLWAIITFGNALDLLGIHSLNGPNINNFLLIVTIGISPFLAFLLGWGWMAIYFFLWEIAGKEIIEVDEKNLSVTRQIFNWKKSNEYSVKTISNLRLNTKKTNSIKAIQRFLGKDGVIAFNYGEKAFCFGLDIENSEGSQIIAILQEYLPKQNMG